MNNMTEKIIQDGSETRRARFNAPTIVIGALLLCLGILLLVIKASSVEYVDASGILHENFFLLPLGFLSIFCGLIAFTTVGIKTIVKKVKEKVRDKRQNRK
jgi:predicted membrane protein